MAASGRARARTRGRREGEGTWGLLELLVTGEEARDADDCAREEQWQQGVVETKQRLGTSLGAGFGKGSRGQRRARVRGMET